jgi:hypothetical protein
MLGLPIRLFRLLLSNFTESRPKYHPCFFGKKRKLMHPFQTFSRIDPRRASELEIEVRGPIRMRLDPQMLFKGWELPSQIILPLAELEARHHPTLLTKPKPVPLNYFSDKGIVRRKIQPSGPSQNLCS